jgi:hypothetical protein
MGNANSIYDLEEYSLNWKIKKRFRSYEYYVHKNKITRVSKNFGRTTSRVWKVCEGEIKSIQQNTDHILMLDDKGVAYIIKNNKPPSRVRVPWEVVKIYSEHNSCCDFSLLFCLVQGPLGNHYYHVISITESDLGLPRIRAENMAVHEDYNVEKFTTDTITHDGILSKILDLSDSRAQVANREGSIKMKVQLDMPKILSRNDSLTPRYDNMDDYRSLIDSRQ